MKVRKGNTSLASETMCLQGHEGEVTSCQFHPSGYQLASGSLDKTLRIWNVRGNCQNTLRLSAGTPILDLKWLANGDQIVTAGTDHTTALWDLQRAERLRKYKAHTGIVNAVAVSPSSSNLFASVSDDKSLLVCDTRSKAVVKHLLGEYPLTSIAFGALESEIYVGTLSGLILKYDLKDDGFSEVLQGHSDVISGLDWCASRGFLVSAAMDSFVNVWATHGGSIDETVHRRLEPALRIVGASHGYDKNLIKPAVSQDGSFVACGSADRTVMLWNGQNGEILYKLPGHKGTVNQVHFHPSERIILSCSTDKTIIMGEF